MNEENNDLGKKECYKSNIKVLYDKSQDDFIWVEITINDSIANLLNEVCIKDLPKIKCTVYDNNYERYKVKGWLMTGLNYNLLKDLVFHTQLLDEKRVELKFSNIANCLNTIQLYKDNLKVTLQNILKYKTLNTDIEFVLK